MAAQQDCFTGTKVQILTALLVQKYKYWQLRRAAGAWPRSRRWRRYPVYLLYWYKVQILTQKAQFVTEELKMGAIPLTIQPATSVRSAVIPVAGAQFTCFTTRTKVQILLQLCCSSVAALWFLSQVLSLLAWLLVQKYKYCCSSVIPVAGAQFTCFTTRTKIIPLQLCCSSVAALWFLSQVLSLLALPLAQKYKYWRRSCSLLALLVQKYE
jgi:hypothetical protein